jgi:GxxExxY protein
MEHTMESRIRGIAEGIWKSLGPGYSESVYHCAFEVALRSMGLYYETERIVPVYFAGQNVGHVRADLIVDRKYVIELKSVSKLNETYRIQTQNYLQLLDLQEGYLINFPDKKGQFEFENIIREKIVTPILDQIDC